MNKWYNWALLCPFFLLQNMEPPKKRRRLPKKVPSLFFQCSKYIAKERNNELLPDIGALNEPCKGAVAAYLVKNKLRKRLFPVEIVDGSATVQTIPTDTPVQSIAVSPDRKLIASGGGCASMKKGELKIWDIENKKFVVNKFPCTHCITALAFISTEKIIYGTCAGELVLFDSKLNKFTNIKNISNHIIHSLFILKQGTKFLVTTSLNGGLQLYDLEARILEKVYRRDKYFLHRGCSVALTGDEKKLLYGYTDGVIKMWDIETGDCIGTYGSASGPFSVQSIDVSPDNNQIVTGTFMGKICVRDLRSGTITKRFCTSKGSIETIRFIPDSSYIIGVGNRDKQITLWDINANNPTIAHFKGHKEHISCIKGITKNIFVSGSWDESVSIWNSESIVKVYEGNLPLKTALRLADGKKFFSPEEKISVLINNSLF